MDHMRCKCGAIDKWRDPVVWMPRENNKVADGLADLTMDRRLSWQKFFPTTLDWSQAHVIIQTDGGRRAEDCAAANWIFGLWDSDMKKYEPYMAGGIFIEVSCTVFKAEAIAIDEASAHVQSFLRSVANT